MHTPAAYGQWSVFDHNGDNRLAVLGTRYGIWWSWYGQFEVGWLQPLQLWLGAGTSSGAPVLVSQDRDLCHVQLHPTWFEPTSECRSWPVVSYLYSGHLPVGLYLGRGSLLLVGPLFHFRQCHSGLVSSRNEWGSLSPRPWCSEMYDFCTCGLQTWSHSLSHIPVWHSLPAVDVSLWCSESVLENRSPGHRQRVLWRCPWQYKRAAH